MKRYKNINTMFHYKNYNKRVIRLVLLLLFGLAIDVTLFPFFTRRILDIEIPNSNIYGVILFGILDIIVTFFSCYVVLKYCKLRFNIRRSIEKDLRKDIFNKLQYVKIPFYDENTTGEILQLLSNDSDDASNLFPITIVEMLVMGFLRMNVFAILLLIVNSEIALGIILIYILAIIITIMINKKTIEILKQIRMMNIKILDVMNEGIEGFPTIKTLSIEKEEINKLENRINKYNTVENKLNKTMIGYNVIFEMISSFAMVWVLFKGGIDLKTGLVTYGILIVIINWIDMIKADSRFFLKHLTNFNKNYIAFYKILEFIKSNEIENLESGEKLGDIKEIEFKNVSFSYNEQEKVIRNFNLKALSKEKVALVGKTGSGKSTIVNMICRFYEPTEGNILINGKDIKEYNLKELRQRIGYVMQDVVILKHTIIDNIRYVNPNISIEEIEEIFKKLNLHDKIMSLKDNYETNIYDYPDILSKGEKQIINFARIMAMNPDVIILDEVTSSLSYSSEMLLKNAMEQITKNKICFIIAHRLSTVSKCDKIIVMGKGEVLEQGNHEGLLIKKRRIL